MTRRARALVSAARTSGIPDRMIFYDTETYRVPIDENRSDNRLKLGWVCYLDTGQGIERWQEFVTADVFWNFVEQHARERQRLWCFAHFADYDLAVLDWYGQMVEQRGWVITKFIIGKPTCIDLKKGKATVRLVDTMNWFNTSVRALGNTLGFPKGDFDYELIEGVEPGTRDWDELSDYCRRDVDILRKAMQSWMDLVRTRDLGPFAFTAAGQAFTAYRYRFLPDAPVVVPGSDRVLGLERVSYLGGLTAAWHLGPTGPVRVADVTSMYPHVMREHRYPRALEGWYRADRLTTDDLRRQIELGRCVVAQLFVDVPDGMEVAPVKGERLEYPSGRFTTTLTTPEVMACLDAGVVEAVGEVVVYHADVIFRRWVDEMFALRQEYLQEGNSVYADLVKVGFLNSLYGKFGQYNYEWEQIDPVEWEIGDMVTGDVICIDGERRPIRRLGDWVELRSATRLEPALSFPAVAAHVTAYARRLLLDYRAICGVEEVLYADTDSLFLTEAGYRAGVAGGVISDVKRLGLLHHDPDKDAYGAGEIWGLKVYHLERVDGSEVNKIKGVRRGSTELSTGVWEVDNVRGLRGAVRDGDPGRAVTIHQRREVTAITDPTGRGRYRKGTRQASGWVIPNQRSESAPSWVR